MVPLLLKGYPADASGKEPICQCRKYKRCGFDPWVRKIPWRRHSILGDLPNTGIEPWSAALEAVFFIFFFFFFFTTESPGSAYMDKKVNVYWTTLYIELTKKLVQAFP